ncbi:stress protein [Streptomyces decoyicus]|uniref:stress protein n=1 Tax=Streptomyces decoyicus TaxID=249567 RepID=UPI000662088B|nr:stress protein [Streptomyces decoyicus]KOG42695.1 stress protein [Streptomyces decoyicus]QZY16485.1 stress protein [Streptomyces decoyicus]
MSTKNIVKKSVAAAALCAALCGTAVAFPATASAAPAAPAAAAKGGPTGTIGASLNVNVDVLGIANKIEASIKTAQNREGFVKGLMESAYYAAGGQYNVMVHNLQQPYEENLNGVKTFATTTYDGVTYGIWVFEDGEFTNQGDGGWINWAAKGYIERPDNGGLMIFTRH